MTTLYIFDDEGQLAFCDEVLISQKCLRNIEQIGETTLAASRRSFLTNLSEMADFTTPNNTVLRPIAG